MSIRIEDGVPWVGDRSFPWASGVDNRDTEHRDYWFRERRFRLTFESGWTLSVVWGSGTYSTNRDLGYTGGSNPDFHEEADTVEIAAWLPEGEMVEWAEGDIVRGWTTEPELLALIDDMMGWPSEVPDCFVARIPELSS